MPNAKELLDRCGLYNWGHLTCSIDWQLKRVVIGFHHDETRCTEVPLDPSTAMDFAALVAGAVGRLESGSRGEE